MLSDGDHESPHEIHLRVTCHREAVITDSEGYPTKLAGQLPNVSAAERLAVSMLAGVAVLLWT